MSQPTVPFDLYGDTVTEGLGQIFGSIYEGDPTPLETLIEREDVNEYVRDAAIDVFLVLEHTGQLSREQVVGYFQRLFGGRLQRTHSHAWNGLVIAVGLDDRDQLDVLPGAGHRDEASGVIVDQADNGETNGIGFGTEGTSRQGEESDQENGERFHGEVSEISAPRMAQTERAAQPFTGW